MRYHLALSLALFFSLSLLDSSDISHVQISCVCPSTTTRPVGPNSSKVSPPGAWVLGLKDIDDCHSVCVCVRDCYAFHSVCVMPPVKFACARGSGDQIGATEIRSERRGSDQLAERKDDHLLKTPTPATFRTLPLRNT